jgi:hypothetical protein
MTWALLQRAWIIETGGTLMVLSKRERNAPEVVLIRAPIDEVRALIRKPAPRPKRIRRRPCHGFVWRRRSSPPRITRA